MPDVNSQLSSEIMPRDFSTISQRGVNSRAMNNVISPDPIMTVCVMRGVRACLNSGTDRADARAAVWMPSLHPSLDPGED